MTDQTTEEIIVAARYNGPPDSGNGGYTAGLVAAALGAERTGAVATLRTPPPLDTPLRVHQTGRGITVCHGDMLVVEATTADLDEEPAAPVAYHEAVTAARDYPGFADHPFPTCYVCGPRRAAGDGLRIFPGPLPGGRTAAPWTVPPDANAVTLWAALDCPGGWSIIAPGRPYVLGRMVATVHTVPQAGTQCVVTGMTDRTEGRKALVRSAVYGEDGAVLAQAHSTWIAI